MIQKIDHINEDLEMSTILETPPTIILLNGNCSSGKSTLADELSKQLEKSIIIRCDEVSLKVFQEIVKQENLNIDHLQNKDLLSLIYQSNLKIDREDLEDRINHEMYQQIKFYYNQGYHVIQDITWIEDHEEKLFTEHLKNYNTLKIFVHCRLEDNLRRVLQRNIEKPVIEHRVITLPFHALPLIYQPTNHEHDLVVDVWDRDELTFLFKNLSNEYKKLKDSYSDDWKNEAEKFFQRQNRFFKNFQLDTHEKIKVTPTFAFDYSVNTTEFKTEECAKKIILELMKRSD